MAGKKTNVYNEDSIKVLEFPYNVQKRPTMYIGELGIAGCNHLLKEVIDNAVDEHLNGFGNIIKVNISNKLGYAEVIDEGRGIPERAIETAFCKLHSSGKFDKEEYSVSAGMNGVGTSAVNALSTQFIVKTRRDGSEYEQKFENGLKKTDVTKIGSSKKTGSTIIFYPNKEFMEEVQFDLKTIMTELEMKSYINKGLKLIFTNIDTKEIKEYLHKNGISELVSDNCKKKLVDPINISGDIEVKNPRNKMVKISVDISFTYNDSQTTVIDSFCNSLYTVDGGTHVTGLKMSLTSIIKKYIEDNKLLPKKDADLEITGDEIQSGLVAVVAIKHPEPQFNSQTKHKLTNSEIQGAIIKLMNDKLNDFANNNEKVMKLICQKVIIAARAAEAARKAKENINKKSDNVFTAVSDLSKLANCISKDTNINELFIVEGDSAAGTAKACRDKNAQAIYALRGKPLNSNNMELVKIMENKELSDLSYILTGTRGNLDNNFNIDDLKYGKVLIMSDADDDGFHIQSLMISFFFQHCRKLIEDGHVYVTMPPLYSIIERNKKRYFLNQKEYDDYIFEKLNKDYQFISEDGKVLKKAENIKKLISINEKYLNALKEYSLECGVNYHFLDQLTHYPNKTKKELVTEIIESLGDLSIDNNEIVGIFYDNKYIQVNIGKLDEYRKATIELKKKFKIPSGIKVKHEDKELLLNIYQFENILKAITPKSRSRFKGLGEMDADELWDTTMNPNTRNLLQVVISDEKQTSTVMDELLNDKCADKRKVFLMKNQTKIKELELEI